MNQIIQRREIITNINDKYVGLEKKNISAMTWGEKVKRNHVSKERGKFTKYHTEYRQEGERIPQSELDEEELRAGGSLAQSSEFGSTVSGYGRRGYTR